MMSKEQASKFYIKVRVRFPRNADTGTSMYHVDGKLYSRKLYSYLAPKSLNCKVDDIVLVDSPYSGISEVRVFEVASEVSETADKINPKLVLENTSKVLNKSDIPTSDVVDIKVDDKALERSLVERTLVQQIQENGMFLHEVLNRKLAIIRTSGNRTYAEKATIRKLGNVARSAAHFHSSDTQPAKNIVEARADLQKAIEQEIAADRAVVEQKRAFYANLYFAGYTQEDYSKQVPNA